MMLKSALPAIGEGETLMDYRARLIAEHGISFWRSLHRKLIAGFRWAGTFGISRKRD